MLTNDAESAKGVPLAFRKRDKIPRTPIRDYVNIEEDDVLQTEEEASGKTLDCVTVDKDSIKGSKSRKSFWKRFCNIC